MPFITIWVGQVYFLRKVLIFTLLLRALIQIYYSFNNKYSHKHIYRERERKLSTRTTLEDKKVFCCDKMYRMRGEFLEFRLSAFSASNIYSHDLSKVSLLKSLIVLAYTCVGKLTLRPTREKFSILNFSTENKEQHFR